jgi:hypothetical protein
MPIMSRAYLMAIAWAAGFSAVAAAWPAAAQEPTPTGTGPSAIIPSTRPRIEVNPRPAYRRCTSWYVIQYRPSGQVLFPQQHCWWQR